MEPTHEPKPDLKVVEDSGLEKPKPGTAGAAGAAGNVRIAPDPEKRQLLADALKNIEKDFGKGAVIRLGDDPSRLGAPVEVISTGSLGLDIALGVGGVPRGRVVEIYGPESSGKTTMALHVAAEAQKLGGVCAFIDAEHAVDPIYAGKLGVNTADLLLSQPDSGEQALEIADNLVKSGGVDVLVIDSVAALVPRAELEGEMGDTHVGLQARLMSQALRKLTSTIAQSETVVIFINQIRMRINSGYGSPETTSGGNALKFYASVRLDIRRIGKIMDGTEVVGNLTRVKVVKNKVAPPLRIAEFDILYGKGVSRVGEILDMGVAHGRLLKSGAWYSLPPEPGSSPDQGGMRIGQGRERAREYLEKNPGVASRIEQEVRKIILES